MDLLTVGPFLVGVPVLAFGAWLVTRPASPPPIHVSDELLKALKAAAETEHRSVDQQLEFPAWTGKRALQALALPASTEHVLPADPASCH